MTPPTPGYALMRKAVLSLAVKNTFTQRFADPRQSLPYTYAQSPMTSFSQQDQQFKKGPEAGACAINQKISDDDYLLDYLGLGFSGFYFSDNGEIPENIQKLFDQLDVGGDVFTPIVLNRSAHGHIFEAYGADIETFYLIRPDRHIAARWRHIQPDEVVHALKIALGEK